MSRSIARTVRTGWPRMALCQFERRVVGYFDAALLR